MQDNRADLRSSARALFGEWAGDRDAPLPPLPDGLPDGVAPIARDAVAMLAQYQGIALARLYLHRLRRFIGRRDVDPALFARIAYLMAERMAYQDPVRLAQLALEAVERGDFRVQRCRFRLDELVAPLPASIAQLILDILGWLGCARWTMTRRYFGGNAFGRARLRLEAGLRSWRGLSGSYQRERLWVERWLHMVDRALAKQPAAAAVLVDTATMIEGYGEPYRQGLADWHLIIDGLVKPAFDGDLMMPDLAAAIAAARAAASPDPAQAQLKAAIAALRDTATQRAA